MRQPNAIQDLNKLVRNKSKVPFEWGTWDCCIFGADVIFVMTGEDLMKDFRGAYNDRLSAARALREIGEGTLIETLEAHLGEPEDVSYAWRGDIVVHKNNCGVCMGQESAFVGEDGIIFLPTKDMDFAFYIR